MTAQGPSRRATGAKRTRLMAFLASIRDDEPKLLDLVKALEWESYKHYDEHAAEVRAWRKAENI